jgi:hypothetical protein
MRAVVRIYLAIFLALAFASTAMADTRIAFVVGNSDYENVARLANPLNDAQAMARLLTEAGFQSVIVKTDLGVIEFRRALADFEVLAREADLAVVYYSGHGIEFQGQNYLVPVDAAIRREVDVQDEAISLDRVMSTVAGAKKLKLVILDACRVDPFRATSAKRAVNRGLVPVEPSEVNELIAYSAKAGTVAEDGDSGGNSPYTAALLKLLTVPGLDVEFALRKVRDEVLAATHRAQEPYFYGSMGGDELPLVAKLIEGSPALAPAAKLTTPHTPLDIFFSGREFVQTTSVGVFHTVYKPDGTMTFEGIDSTTHKYVRGMNNWTRTSDGFCMGDKPGEVWNCYTVRKISERQWQVLLGGQDAGSWTPP